VAKRGFFAEVQHQARLAEQQQRRQVATHARELAASQRSAEQAQRAAERSYAAAVRMSAAEQKLAQAEAKRLHEESMKAQAELQTLEVTNQHNEIANILQATLGVDDFVDLETLRVVAQHPPFYRPDLQTPTPLPAAIPAPDQPIYQPPARPSGMSRVFGGNKKFDEATAVAQAQHAVLLQQWQEYSAQIPTRQAEQTQRWNEAEQHRQATLAQARAVYDAECLQRDNSARDENSRLDQLIAGLAHDEESAIQEYVGIVLGNSVYPDIFPVEHDYTFNVADHELTLTVSVPAPAELPTVKEVKFNRAKDQLQPVMLAQREQQLRYSTALACTALRSIHEVFEADRDHRIRTVSLTVQTVTIDPGTGRPAAIPLLSAAADRNIFTTYDLAQVDPLATLALMKATISKNPLTLTPINVARDVRG